MVRARFRTGVLASAADSLPFGALRISQKKPLPEKEKQIFGLTAYLFITEFR